MNVTRSTTAGKAIYQGTEGNNVQQKNPQMQKLQKVLKYDTPADHYHLDHSASALTCVKSKQYINR